MPTTLPEIELSDFKNRLYPAALNFSGEAQPEWTQISCMLINDVELVVREAGAAFPEWLNTAAQVSWNGLDGIFMLLNGVLLLADKKNHQEKSTLAKGVINVVGGIQLLVLSFMFGLTLGFLAAIAFTISTFLDLVNTLIDLYVLRRQLRPQGWLEKKLKENNPESNDDIIAARCRYYCNTAEDPGTREKRVGEVKEWLKSFGRDNLVESSTREWNSDNEKEKKDDTNTNNTIQAAIDKQIKNTYRKIAFRVLNFIGMLSFALIFIAFPHIMLLTATITCTAVGIYYGFKYKDKAVDRLKASFFKPVNIEKSDEEETSPLLSNKS